jgi:fumarate hydratase class II
VHPNDDVNLCQSSNDIIPSALHIGLVQDISLRLLPALESLHLSFRNKAHEFDKLIKIGRTHLQDAVPLTLGQEFSGYIGQLGQARNAIESSLDGLYPLALGGTAVGTGLNAHPQFAARVAQLLTERTNFPFYPAPNKFAAISSHDGIVATHCALKRLAVSLTKIANDLRWLASGPRTGLDELRMPANEPGSSIMPGKSNPTQAEALLMVCLQVMANDMAVSMAASSGQFELNTYQPVLVQCTLQSVRLLADAIQSFDVYCVRGIEANGERLSKNVSHSLMLVTALTPYIGYERAASIAQAASRGTASIKDSALQSGEVTSEQFDLWVQPENMVRSDNSAISIAATSLTPAIDLENLPECV